MGSTRVLVKQKGEGGAVAGTLAPLKNGHSTEMKRRFTDSMQWHRLSPRPSREPCCGGWGCCWEKSAQQNAQTFSELGRRATRAPLWAGVTGKFWHVAQEQNPYQPQSSLQQGHLCVLRCSDGKDPPSMHLESGQGKRRCCLPQLGFTISASESRKAHIIWEWGADSVGEGVPTADSGYFHTLPASHPVKLTSVRKGSIYEHLPRAWSGATQTPMLPSSVSPQSPVRWAVVSVYREEVWGSDYVLLGN